MDQLECVWTCASLKDSFEIDYVIPFGPWRENDSWNLLPASKNSNSKKSNKLPSSELVQKRKDCIDALRKKINVKDGLNFKKEAETLLVLPLSNWQNALFNQMSIAIEMTSLQRGIQRYIAT